MLAITVSATRGYLHAWPQCIRAIAAAAAHHDEAHFIFSTDESREAEAAAELAKRELPEGWKVSVLKHPFKDDPKDYKEAAQLRIAALQGAGFAFARKIRADQCWVVESDTIVPAHGLRVLEWTLAMPQADGRPYYDIAAATYPNGLFLGGFGSPQRQIAEDFLPEERNLKPRLKVLLEKCEERLKAIKPPTNAKEAESAQKIGEKEGKRMGRLREWVKKSPPTGNVFELNAKGYRRRGWMDFAYPGIGLGAVVPSDWCGLGCTLLSKSALAHADFTGYEGRGTQDLFLCWERWHPAGLKIACVPHVACDHIKRKPADAPKEMPEIVHYRAFHEQEGECRGHLRVRQQAFVSV
jgi:hypothetical protein